MRSAASWHRGRLPLTARSRGRPVLFGVPAFSQPNVRLIADLMEPGASRPVIDRVYPLEQVVEANRYVESERKTGNVVLAVAWAAVRTGVPPGTARVQKASEKGEARWLGSLSKRF